VFVFSIVSGGGPRVPDPDMSMSRPASTGQVSTGRVGSVVATSPLGCAPAVRRVNTLAPRTRTAKTCAY
jgi:hypothetical protein